MEVVDFTPVDVQAKIDELQAETQMKMTKLMDEFSVDYRIIVGMLEELKMPYLVSFELEEE